MTIRFDQDIELDFQRNTFIYIVPKDNTKKKKLMAINSFTGNNNGIDDARYQ